MNPGHGTYRPLGEAEAITFPDPPHLFLPRSVQKSASAAHSLRPHLLIAEDDSRQRLLLRAILEAQGWSVTACADGLEALDAFDALHTFDILITDVEMPRLSGLELVRMVALRDPFLPVILVSGAAPSDELRQLVNDRELLFLPKPFAVLSMLAAVRHRLPVPQRISTFGLRIA